MINNNPKIRVMPDSLASQVAAGEVVESPSSIVKELIENSIDAGAKKIKIIITGGGKILIKVIDDGCGMSREDAILSIERHATSKIKDKKDLTNITTFGFRGEALPSIASVSNFRLITSSNEDMIGTEIIIKGGKLIEVNECGAEVGTQIEVKSLFYNIPARKKFLKSDSAEFSKIERVVIAASLSSPDICYSLYHGKRSVLNLSRSTNFKNRILDLFGADFTEKLIEFSSSDNNGVRLNGFISRPDYNFTSKKYQYLFVNGRYVKYSSINVSIRNAFKGLIDKRMNPALILFINIEPYQVDVNVHPSKEQVKFDKANKVQNFITDTIVESLSSDLKSSNPIVKDLAPLSEMKMISGHIPENGDIQDHSIEFIHNNIYENEKIIDSNEGVTEKKFKVIGVLKKKFILIQNDEGLIIMSKRSAHERVLYEKIIKNLEGDKNPEIQRLLVPLTLDLHTDEFEVLFRYELNFQKLGFIYEEFGGNTIKLESVPGFLEVGNIEKFFRNILTEAIENGLDSAKHSSYEFLSGTLANLTSRYYDLNSNQELEKLLEQLLQCDMPYVDTRGRPTLFQLSYNEIEKKLGQK